MTRRWFLGAISGALVGAFADPIHEEPLVKAFSGDVTVKEDGELRITLDMLEALMGQTPMTRLSMKNDGLRIWEINGYMPEPGQVTLTADLPHGGRMSFVEDRAEGGRQMVGVTTLLGGTPNPARFGHPSGFGRNAVPQGDPKFIWKIGRLPIPDTTVEFLPATHALGAWVRKYNRAARLQAIQAGREAGVQFIPGIVL